MGWMDNRTVTMPIPTKQQDELIEYAEATLDDASAQLNRLLTDPSTSFLFAPLEPEIDETEDKEPS